MNRAYRNLLPDERAALQAFADAYGRRWRDVLDNVYWYNARIWRGPVEGQGNILHAIRNEFGPTWLHKVCDIKQRSRVR
ncbi:hypothetical protein [Sinorhizobium chiapasense]|uniref:Uncharacterized protein n=1 Tax=Sinorhizobium chiapasense TaxID=501572 RepID=A0ABZ2BBG5_9HYPH